MSAPAFDIVAAWPDANAPAATRAHDASGAPPAQGRWWQRLWRRRVSDAALSRDAAAFAARLNEAAALWCTHLDTVQDQMQEATAHLLEGFGRILADLDGIIDPRADRGAGSAREIDQRADVLANCERRLQALVGQLHGFLESRNQVLGSMRALTEASGKLQTMAEDVGSLARQTNLLSINAAIEAARAGESGRGFAVVASEVRRLSGESGQTGRRIADVVQDFAGQMQQTLSQADEHSRTDSSAIQASEQTVGEVIADVDATVSALNERAAQLRVRGEGIKAQVEMLMMAFQFQDRVAQILGQVRASINAATGELQGAIARGRAPETAHWAALLNAGYTTAEQRHAGGRHAEATAHAPAADGAAGATTFF